ncbi:hypothetical protein HGRIS_006349 [Hohenbuehelia grisea]|uniref:BTB domain-containing protein n=1 Tax=Hohenbuehelia grisea TaxID=104357 RepID=A0ABR3JZM6_9AGAR
MDSEVDMDLADVEAIVHEPTSRASSPIRIIRRRSDDAGLSSSSKRARIDIAPDHESVSQSPLTHGLPLPFQGGSANTLAFPTLSSCSMEPSPQQGDAILVEGVDLAVVPSLSSKSGPLDIQRLYTRDPNYYIEDGSCILLVEDTLFNVHRTILSKDSSSFSAMFSLPQAQTSEGRSDNNPIIIHGDTAAEFRDFLWALYALPPELRVVNSPNADLNQLINIARISNKYTFKTLETWALDAIHEYVNQRPSPIHKIIPHPSSFTFIPHMNHDSPSLTTCMNIESTAQLTRLIRLAQMCSHERLLETMIDLLKKLMDESLQYAYLSMALADELNLRALKGPAYLVVMHKAMLVNKLRIKLPGKSTPQILTIGEVTPVVQHSAGPAVSDSEGEDEPLVVNPAQQLRLLSGYYRLARTWETLRLKPPHFDHAPSCGATWHQHGCTQSWQEFWKEKTRGDTVLSYGLADVLGRLKQVQKEYDRWGSATYMHHDCRMAARKSIQELIKAVEDALPDYFSEGDF